MARATEGRGFTDEGPGSRPPRFRGTLRTQVPVMVLMVQMVLLDALAIPLSLTACTLGMLDSILGLVIVYLAFSPPFSIWNLCGYVAAVPKELEEAAYMDGAHWLRMFRSVLLPRVSPGLAATLPVVISFVLVQRNLASGLTAGAVKG